MRNIHFTTEQKLLHRLVLHANDMPVSGLFNGQMGIVVVLAKYARFYNLPSLETAVDFLMEQIMNRLTTLTPPDLGNGLAGVGWGIEYLLQNGYTKGCGAEICEEIDRKLMEYDVRRINDLTLQTGLEGILHYVTAHIQGANADGHNVFDTTYLIDWQTKLATCQETGLTRPEMNKLAATFTRTLQGIPQSYTWSLQPFIQTSISRRTTLLGLHNGVAGLLALQMEGGEA